MEEIPAPHQANKQEHAPEHIPSKEEIQGIFAQIFENKEYTTRLDNSGNPVEKKDDEGLVLWEIELSEKDENKYTQEYHYTRNYRTVEGKMEIFITIHLVFSDDDGDPVPGGGAVAKYINNSWTMIDYMDSG